MFNEDNAVRSEDAPIVLQLDAVDLDVQLLEQRFEFEGGSSGGGGW